ncbi:hypothetical protein [Nostoc linckia]|uniref:hypothetical protein n=2 Tax=Nostoc linckia TaxID=92942 RepID=UPI0015D479AD|nr:hypothetical protein [Nostoc linckia]
MIHGNVVGLQARMNVIILPPERSGVEIECVIDTGFEGFLTLPPSIIAALGLPYLININANLANNSTVETDVYQTEFRSQEPEFRMNSVRVVDE